jgi:hypothetical protein
MVIERGVDTAPTTELVPRRLRSIVQALDGRDVGTDRALVVTRPS